MSDTTKSGRRRWGPEKEAEESEEADWLKEYRHQKGLESSQAMSEQTDVLGIRGFVLSPDLALDIVLSLYTALLYIMNSKTRRGFFKFHKDLK